MPKKSKPDSPTARSFQATLERMRSRLHWTIVRIPFDAAKAFGVNGQIKIKGSVNGFAFRTSLFATRDGGHILLVNKRMQKGANVRVGTVARFEIELDTEKRIPAIPEPFERILRQDRALRRWYEQLNNSTHVEIGKWISEPASDAARARRADQIAERLLETMEAERELPPLLQTALARNPKARDGWELMSAARRRSNLMAIFYYRTPESRLRRMEKVLDEAVAIAEKHASD
jgi:uncharacterized protein YdeI (YjbR/CyaY-like superfamily)